MSSQFVLEGFGRCSCWVRRNAGGLIVSAHSCDDCLSRALDFLNSLLDIDKESSVSASIGSERADG